MVIFKRKNRMLDTFWDTLSEDLKQEFERDYSAWNSFSGDRERIIAMNLFISEFKEREQRGEYQQFFEEGFRRVIDHYDSLMNGFREEIGGAVRNVEGRVINIEERVTQIKATAQDSLNTRMLEANNPVTSEPRNFVMPVTTTGSCRYDKEKGPQDCMRYVEREGGTYASCTVADQIRRKQILPNFLTSVFEKTGCPSDWYIARCDYLDKKEIKTS